MPEAVVGFAILIYPEPSFVLEDEACFKRLMLLFSESWGTFRLLSAVALADEEEPFCADCVLGSLSWILC